MSKSEMEQHLNQLNASSHDVLELENRLAMNESKSKPKILNESNSNAEMLVKRLTKEKQE